jgi:hypothetical protein
MMATVTGTAPIVAPAMAEVATALSDGLPAAVTVWARPVDTVTAPAVVVTAADPLLTSGGSHCLYTVRLSVVVIAGRFTLAGTWDTLISLGESSYAICETLDGVVVEALGRIGPVEAGGIDYLAGVLDLTMFRD